MTTDTIFPRMVELRRQLHQRPELAYQEVETARLIMTELDRLGIPYEYGGAGTAVVGRLGRKGSGPSVALRAEMDGLCCTERTGLPFASVEPDRMHACGHDAHMAMLLGSAALLSANPPPAGHVTFLFQPAEETGNGACSVLDSKLLEGTEAIFAAHVTHHYRLGEIMVSEGQITAQADRFTIRIRGKGGHGARPHEAIDAVVVTGLLVTAVQTLVSRETNPVHPSVITIGSIHAGSAHNVIAEDAVLEGTIRTTQPESRERLLRGLERMTRAVGELHAAEINVTFGENSPPVINTPRETTVARRAAEQVVGAASVVPQDYPSMGAEDFSFYLGTIPGCYVRLGSRGADDTYIPLHSPLFDVDEGVLKVGASFFDRVAREALAELASSST